MAKKCFPVQLEPVRCANNRRQLRGQMQLADMSRLKPLLAPGVDLAVDVALDFDRDKQGVVVIRLQVSGKLPLICQRTVELFYQEVELAVELAPIYHEREAERLPENYEPLLVTNHVVSPAKIVEDELILTVPMVPKLEEPALRNEIASNNSEHTGCHRPFNQLTDWQTDDNKQQGD